MGVNDEYSRDAYTFEQVWDSDSDDEIDRELDPEDWEAAYSEEIYDGWVTFKEYLHDNFLEMHQNCTYTKFVHLLLNPICYYSNNPSIHALRAWTRIKRVSIVNERVDPENFYSWFDIYVIQ